jgi:xanthine dehydrogenase YagS FAD-binding subunit
MRPLSYARVEDVDAAVALVSADPASAFLAGGTTKVDLVRIGVDRSDRLIDINRLPLASVEEVDGGTVRIGALAGAASQHGLDGWKLVPARSLRVLP